ncbi:hypothetical protein D3C80_1151390 [compost metagenome]
MSNIRDWQVVEARKLRDLELAELIELVEQGLQLDLTVLFNGMMLSGKVISGTKYYEILAENFDNLNQPLSTYFSSVGLQRYANQDEKEEPLLNFIHFEDVRIQIGSNQLMNLPGQPCRVKLEEINGHFHGLMSTNGK